MDTKRLVLIGIVIPSFFLAPAQGRVTILNFDQHYILFSDGNLKATWNITILPSEGTDTMVLHTIFSSKAYIKEVTVTDSEGSLNSKLLTREGVPVLEITFRKRLPPGTQYNFTVNVEVWKALEVGETEGSFTMLTGYLYPVEKLTVSATLPEGTKLRTFYPASGRASGEDVVWAMQSLPAGYTIQVSLSFDVLSETFADSLFTDGVNLYTAGDLDNARTKFVQAQEVYTSLNLTDKADQCAVYLIRIEGLKEGLPLYNEAVGLYNEKRYQEAQAKFEEARAVYADHQLSTDEIDQYISSCITHVKAQEELQMAEALLSEGKKKEARDHFLEARKLFSSVNETALVQEIDSQLAQIDAEPSPAPAAQRGTGLFFVVGIVGMVVVVAAVAVAKRGRPAPVQSEAELQEEMRKVKARYVYGEINKKEYEEKLAALEKQLKGKK